MLFRVQISKCIQSMLIMFLVYKFATFKRNLKSFDRQTKIVNCFEVHGFNECLSNQISVTRKVPDHRSEYCRNIEFSRKNFPPTSIIITFYNEAWSTLLRSVHSVLDRSPGHLIEEILLIDDFSDLGRFEDSKKLVFELFFIQN